jgi:8-oxo-dGTP diphosphatase
MKRLFKYGLAIIRNNKLLVLEPYNTSTFKKGKDSYCLMPGGVVEGNETPEECLKREIREELDVDINMKSLKFLGNFADVAAGKKDTIIEQDVYVGEIIGEPKPCSEIQKIIWFSKNDDRRILSPIIRNKILPALIEKGYLKW